jgi:DNA-binding NtrC family response regulator
MKDEEKTKEALISELKTLRKKYTELKDVFLKNQDVKLVGGNETILVVDDNEDIRKTIVAMLEKCGYNAIEADSSRTAIEIFKFHGGTIHLVLSDVVMPEISGPEMVKTLYEMQKEIKVVFMSGFTEDDVILDDVLKILHSQTSFIEKPFTFQEICRVVRQQLDKKP